MHRTQLALVLGCLGLACPAHCSCRQNFETFQFETTDKFHVNWMVHARHRLDFGQWCVLNFVDYPPIIYDGTFNLVKSHDVGVKVSQIKSTADTKEALAVLTDFDKGTDNKIGRIDEALAFVYLSETVDSRPAWLASHPEGLKSARRVLRDTFKIESMAGTLDFNRGLAGLALARLEDDAVKIVNIYRRIVDCGAGDTLFLAMSASVLLCRELVHLRRFPEAHAAAVVGIEKCITLESYNNLFVLRAIAGDPENGVRGFESFRPVNGK